MKYLTMDGSAAFDHCSTAAAQSDKAAAVVDNQLCTSICKSASDETPQQLGLLRLQNPRCILDCIINPWEPDGPHASLMTHL